MLLAPRYPLPEDLGYPNGVRAGRQRWVTMARRKRTWLRRWPVIAVVLVTFLFSGIGLMPWIARAAFSPRSLANDLSRDMPMGNAHLGAEYYNIASAVVEGRGFADPFVVQSGPTAWMPPLLVGIEAFWIWVTGGDRYYVMLAIVLLKSIVLSVGVAAVVAQASRRNVGWLAFAVVLTFLLCEAHDCFTFTHDSWLIFGSVTATLFGIVAVDRRVRDGTWRTAGAIGWGVMGGVIALSSPVAGFTWAVATTVATARRATALWIVSGIVSIVVITPWAVRNRVTLGKWVPIKSNVYFEFDQSLAIDQDGLLDWSTFGTHPYHAGAERDSYVEMGEIAYLETKKQRFRQQVRDEPATFFRKIRNRAIGTMLLPIGFSEYKQGSCLLPFRWLLYPLPLAAIVVLCFGPTRMTSLQRFAIVIYFAYLFPYVLCSYYPRYGFPLLAIKMLLLFWLVERIYRRILAARVVAV